jgi:hypothetical protein
MNKKKYTNNNYSSILIHIFWKGIIMTYQETGRFGRITKNLRKLGFEKEMEKILFDSSNFPGLKKSEQSKYVKLTFSIT